MGEVIYLKIKPRRRTILFKLVGIAVEYRSIEKYANINEFYVGRNRSLYEYAKFEG